jgi:hypothetical protein
MSRVAIVLSFDRDTRDGVPIERVKVDLADEDAPADGVDPTTHEHHLAPGDDSPPLSGDYALLTEIEGGAGEEAISGYSDAKNAGTALPGEKRLYARNLDGDIVVHIHLKRDGSMEIANANGSVTLGADGNVAISGSLSVGGDVAADGEVTAQAAGASSVGLSTHTHPDAMGGTGAPVPGS